MKSKIYIHRTDGPRIKFYKSQFETCGAIDYQKYYDDINNWMIICVKSYSYHGSSEKLFYHITICMYIKQKVVCVTLYSWVRNFIKNYKTFLSDINGFFIYTYISMWWNHVETCIKWEHTANWFMACNFILNVIATIFYILKNYTCTQFLKNSNI